MTYPESHASTADTSRFQFIEQITKTDTNGEITYVIQSVGLRATYCVRRLQRRGGAVVAAETSTHVEQVSEDSPEEDLYVLRRCLLNLCFT
jgi:hypothetical protein